MPVTSNLCKVSDTEWLRAFGEVNANDIDEGWLSVTIAKIREQMGKQLSYLEGVKKPDEQTNLPPPAERTENVRLAIQLQKSAMELAKMEEKRDARLARKHKGRSVDEKRKSLSGKAAALRADGGGRSLSRKPER
jgi:hypothetical protein